MENKEVNVYKVAIKRNLRAWKILWELCPKVFVSSILSAIFKSLSPYITIWLSAQLINELAGNRDLQQLTKWIVIQLSALALFALINGILSRWYNYESESCEKVHERVYMDKMLSLDFVSIDSQSTYDLYSQIRQSEGWAGWGLKKTLTIFNEMISDMVMIGGGLFLAGSLFSNQLPTNHSLAFLNHPLFAVGILILMLSIAILSSLCTNKGNQYWSGYGEKARLGNRYFSFYGFLCVDRKRATDIRIYSQQENICDVYFAKCQSFGPDSEIAKYARGSMGMWFTLSKCISVFLTAIIYLFVCLKAWGGAFGIGSVTQYVGAITNMFTGIGNFIEHIGTMKANSDFLEVNFELLDIPNQMYQGSLTTEKRADRQYKIEFRNVSFQYPGTNEWALSNINMEFNIGSKMAVVGMNGSGKTTFIKLLCRLYDPTEGQILLNGIDIKKYKYEDYIHIFSVVFQDFVLMPLPLGENVAGNMKYDRKWVETCLHQAAFDRGLDKLEKGLDTYLYKELDKEGVEISGGEAQKIAIARALYKDAPFIILDEPTAALDPIAEAEIYSKFNDIVSDRTAVYISHRLSSCKFCDEILVFHKGHMIQQGSHNDLVAEEDGKYYELWNSQAQYYMEA